MLHGDDLVHHNSSCAYALPHASCDDGELDYGGVLDCDGVLGVSCGGFGDDRAELSSL